VANDVKSPSKKEEKCSTILSVNLTELAQQMELQVVVTPNSPPHLPFSPHLTPRGKDKGVPCLMRSVSGVLISLP